MPSLCGTVWPVSVPFFRSTLYPGKSYFSGRMIPVGGYFRVWRPTARAGRNAQTDLRINQRSRDSDPNRLNWKKTFTFLLRRG
jgi:hypothetical protein